MGSGDVRLFDRFAPLYDRVRPATRRRKLRPLFSLADREVERVLDLAGGSGQGTRAIDRDGIVLDAAPGMLARARRRGLVAVRGDATRLPIRSASVDAVLVLDALHHVGDPESVVRESARVLRPGGVLYLLEIDPTTIPGGLLVGAEHLVGFESTFFAPGDLEAMVRATGLETSIPRRGFEYAVAGVKR